MAKPNIINISYTWSIQTQQLGIFLGIFLKYHYIFDKYLASDRRPTPI